MSTTNRVAPTKDDVNKTAVQRHISVVFDSFEWLAKAGRTSEHSMWIVLLFSAIQLFCASLLAFAPLFIYLKGNDLGLDDLILDKDSFDVQDEILPGKLNTFISNMVRTTTVFGAGWIVFAFVMALLAAVPFIAQMGRSRNKLLSVRMMNTLQGLDALSPYISLVLGSGVASIVAKYFYSDSDYLKDTLKQVTQASGQSADANQVTKHMVEMFEHIPAAIARMQHYRFMFPVIVYLTSSALLILFTQKFILQAIAIHYRTATSAGRFTTNIIAMKLVKYLIRAKVDRQLLVADKHIGRTFDRDIVGSVYDAMVAEDSNVLLTQADLVKVLGDEQARMLFGILDLAQNGDMTRDEFISGIEAVFDESHALENLVRDHDNIIAKLDSIMMFIVYGLDVLLALGYLGVSGTALAVTTMLLLIGSISFFSGAVEKLIKSLIFVLVTHPYDAGDRVMIDDEIYVIENVGLWATVMFAPGALRTTVINAALFDKQISNFRRSPSENEVMDFLVHPDTVSEESLMALKEDCLNFLREHRREFQPLVQLDAVDYIDAERVKVSIKIFHRQNFQDDDAMAERSMIFLLHAKDAFLRNGFVFSPPLQKVLVAQL